MNTECESMKPDNRIDGSQSPSDWFPQSCRSLKSFLKGVIELHSANHEWDARD